MFGTVCPNVSTQYTRCDATSGWRSCDEFDLLRFPAGCI